VKTVVYCNPFVPAEWIEAHGLRAEWIVPEHAAKHAEPAAVRGMCPYAQAVLDAVADSGSPAGGHALAVLTTACDQMRHGAGMLADAGREDIFVLNVPSTWQSPGSRDYYAAELTRLGRWLIARGATAPSAERLARAMRDNDAARDRFRKGTIPTDAPSWCNPVAVELARRIATTDGGGIAVGLIGSPLLPHDLAIARAVVEAGGRIVFDGTCGGPRTLPEPFEPSAMAANPFDELVRAYFDAIPAVFRRPAAQLDAWVARAMEQYRPAALLCLRRVWCDLWHAALPRLRETAGVPVLDLDLDDEQEGGQQRLTSRIEALFESIRDRAATRALPPDG